MATQAFTPALGKKRRRRESRSNGGKALPTRRPITGSVSTSNPDADLRTPIQRQAARQEAVGRSADIRDIVLLSVVVKLNATDADA